MRFEAFRWLWAILLLPVGWLIIVADERKRLKRAAALIAEKLWTTVIPEIDPSARLKKGVLALLATVFAFVALARPQWGQHEETAIATGLDIMVVLDVSNSMETEDIPPSRLKKAKHFVRSLLDRLHGDRVGLVAFAGSAYLASPLTTDAEYVAQVLQLLSPRSILNQGTDIGAGLDTAARALDRGAEDVKGQSAAKAGTRVILLISDGEDHAEAFDRAAEAVKRSGNRLFVLGIGTERGGPVPVRDEGGQLVGHKKDRAGRPVVSTFHPDALNQVATAAGGRYWTLSQSESELEELIEEMGTLNRSEFEERHYSVYYERFQIPLALAVFFLLAELILPARRMRKGVGKAAGLAAVFSLFFAGCTDLPVYLSNQRAIRATQAGKVHEARDALASAQARDPDSPPLRYNQGVLQLNEKDPQGSIAAFNDASELARAQQDRFTQAVSQFNLAATLAQAEKIEEAGAAYVRAIEAAQAVGDKSLEQDARKNLQLLLKTQQQQQKQKQQSQSEQKKEGQGQNQGQGQSEKSDENSPGKKPGDQDKPQPQNPPQYTNKGEAKFKSKDLTPEDAERVMQELMERERQLKDKMNRRLEKPPTPNSGDQDW